MAEQARPLPKGKKKRKKQIPLSLPRWVWLSLGLFLFILLLLLVHPKEPKLTTISFLTGEKAIPADVQKVSSSHSVGSSQWNLILVNRWHTLPEGFQVELTQLRNNHAIDSRAYPDLQDMMDDMRTQGLSPLICSSYRTTADQENLFSAQNQKYLSQGLSQKEAQAEAALLVALPGTSEHQTGLAVDIVDTSYQLLETDQENTPVQIWLHQNAWQYGFILRYPRGKTEITGKSYEPWHYRYVGKDAAREIHQSGLCLEEYLNDTHR